mmetsp:Transcript_16096/g.50601  ORF Transcript_16096/g.50601 Transcript_16096/m.50601 type:complete len:249 (-) Transcript_16096:37-783(-)
MHLVAPSPPPSLPWDCALGGKLSPSHPERALPRRRHAIPRLEAGHGAPSEGLADLCIVRPIVHLEGLVGVPQGGAAGALLVQQVPNEPQSLHRHEAEVDYVGRLARRVVGEDVRSPLAAGAARDTQFSRGRGRPRVRHVKFPEGRVQGGDPCPIEDSRSKVGKQPRRELHEHSVARRPREEPLLFRRHLTADLGEDLWLGALQPRRLPAARAHGSGHLARRGAVATPRRGRGPARAAHPRTVHPRRRS